ncbi:MAG TPA: endo alpha-1,4 polygalactosaminidase [Myxococcaceae bacterium]|nr:endo alpha-1,4 polygalactosaminidase [Myxococcaceae bacterium]
MLLAWVAGSGCSGLVEVGDGPSLDSTEPLAVGRPKRDGGVPGGGKPGGGGGTPDGGGGGTPDGGGGGTPDGGTGGGGWSFGEPARWLSYYGSASRMGDLSRVAAEFRVINVDADPATGNFTPAQLAALKAGGQNRVISYLNLGSCETWRSYWSSAPVGLVPCSRNTAAHLGAYQGYEDEMWMNPGNLAYQALILDHVATRLANQGVDGFFLDNLDVLQHPSCDPSCVQGGLDLVRRLRERFPGLLLVMQNATSDVTRLGMTGGVPFATLLDGISREEVYAPTYEPAAEEQLLAWKAMGLWPGHPFWIATEDYVGSCSNTEAARTAYQRSRAHGFSPYATDASAGQQVICYWPF